MRGKYFFAAAVLIVVFVYIMYKYAINGALYMTTDEARAKIAKKEFDTIVDVRTNMEYNLGHAPDAVHLPIGEIEAKASSVLPNKTARILVYCNTGQRARAASEKLYSMGYKNVRYIGGTYLSLR
jgi:rhodanese-related sulfurtransferase